ncbi:hypothetical protein VA596_05845 [Amycolatopsis sp., V23-08]|uniref:Uncharacterized protein n=1 Tax=Amycolatopsis heterodermiae TaxID=3110235 RepID=A0ABU5QYQ2_9PSEU|nr:hypothetical protein [Amycolatopsis sp., V23-08]MEA5359051.1 hypothetical protein [Amycolatopsis sp., V23-08]
MREPEELWAALPGELRTEIDNLLAEGHTLHAILALREKSGLTPAPGITEGQGLVGFRNGDLHERGLLKPPPEVTVAGMLAAVAEQNLSPLAVEIIWDGDSRGWIPTLCVVVARPEHELVPLGMFPPYVGRTQPTEEASEKGQALAAALGVPFYFPLRDRPDIDQPHWWDRPGA